MKIEVKLKDLILFSLIISLMIFCAIRFTGIDKEIQYKNIQNQVMVNNQNIQLLDQAIGNMQKQNAPIMNLTPEKK